MSNEKMREEFEAWMNDNTGVDCSKMPYCQLEGDNRPQYHNDDDPDGALIVSSMFLAWQASRAKTVPDGYCVVPSSPTESMMDAAFEVCSSRIDVYNAMVQAGKLK